MRVAEPRKGPANCPICGQRVSPAAAVCPSCGVALNTAGVEAATPNIQALQPGTRLAGGKYAVGKVLGQGGFGITYLGSWPARGLPVAIKEFFPLGAVRQGARVVPSASLGSRNFTEAKDRFLQESSTLQRFKHPGIVAVYDVFEENGTVYMVMDYIAGKPLDQVLREKGGILPVGEALAIIRAVGEALSAVHRQDVLHRDLKPENIIIRESDQQPILIDFGAAREYTPDKTQALSVVLTPGYAPPEQYASAVRRGPYSDVYSLAATLYHLVTGEMPASAIERAGGLDLKPPSAINPALKHSPNIDHALMRALSIKVADRPQTVAEFLADLEGKPPARGFSAGHGVNGPNGTSAVSARGRPAQAAPPPRVAPAPPARAVSQTPARIQRLLDLAGRLTGGMEIETAVFRCPVCRQGALGDPGEAVGNVFPCPVCAQAAVRSRLPDPERCPSCEQGHLRSWTPPPDTFFCPVCRLGLAHEEVRGRRWLFWPDAWAVCDRCAASWRQSIWSGDWTLMDGHDDPNGVLRENLRRTRPITQWAAMANRAARQLVCDECDAVFDVLGSGGDRVQWLLPGRGTRNQGWLSHTLSHQQWSKLAAGLSLEDASHFCPSCGATFDQVGESFLLKAAPRDPRDLATRYRGQALNRAEWRRVAAGKRTPQPGLLCPRCAAEFGHPVAREIQTRRDPLQTLWQLDYGGHGYDPYGVAAKWLHRILSEEDWRRLAAGKLLKADEDEIRTQVRQLAYEALTAGEITVDNLQRDYPGPRLPGERPILAFQASKLYRDGERVADTGWLWVTNRRVFFKGNRGNTELPLDRLGRIRAAGSTYVAFQRNDAANSVAYTLVPTQIKINVGNLLLNFSTDAKTIDRVISVAKGNR